MKSSLKHFFEASRPVTLVASIAPVVSACSLAVWMGYRLEWSVAWLCILTAVSLQLAVNFYNDALDSDTGADLKRSGPKRLTSTGEVSRNKMMNWGHGSNLFALIFGIPLVLRGYNIEFGFLFPIFGVASLYLTYAYTGPPIRLAYRGLGEVFVLVFFGLVATWGTHILVTKQWTLLGAFLGIIVGSFSCLLIGVNNLRDVDTDREVQKWTLATRLGANKFYWFIFSLVCFAYGLLVFFIYIRTPFVLCLIALPLAVITLKKSWVGKGTNHNFRLALKLSGVHLLFFCCLFSLVCWLMKWEVL